jgi:hypothetical protein
MYPYYNPVLGTVRPFLEELSKFDGGVCGKIVKGRLKAAAQMSYNYQQTSAIH